MKYLFLIGSASAVISAIPAAAMANEVKQEEIIVTARRSEERLQDVPISISVVSQEAITNRNISNLGDLGAYVPSLAVNNRYGPEKSNFAIRGFTQESKTSPSVGVYFADVAGVRSNSGTAGGNGAGVGDMFDLQNVQVLKGPQGTLFGRNTTGGAVLLVPNKPTDRLEGYVEGSVGNYDMVRVQSVANIPLNETFAIRAGVDWQNRDGYLRNRSGIGPDRLGDVDYLAGRISILAKLSPSLENVLVASFSDSRNHGVAARIKACDTAKASTAAGLTAALGCAQLARQSARGDGFYDVENSQPDAKLQTRQWRVINTTNWEASDYLTVKNIISYGEYRERSTLSVFGENFSLGMVNSLYGIGNTPYAYPNGPLDVISVHPGWSGNNINQSGFTEELQLQGRSEDGRTNWIVGGYMEHSRPLGWSTQYAPAFLTCSNVAMLQCADHFYYVGAPANPYDDVPAGALQSQAAKDYFSTYALFAQVNYKLTEKFSVTGGMRYTWDKVRQVANNRVVIFPPINPTNYANNSYTPSYYTNGFTPVEFCTTISCPQEGKTSSHKPTWLLSAEYKPNDDMMLYTKWARGYRVGGINQQIVGLSSWGPEKVDTYEIGLKKSLTGAIPGYFNIAAYYNDFRNQQLSANLVPKPNTTVSQNQTIVNAGKSRIWGVEVDGGVTPVDGLRFDVGYSYLNTKLQSFTIPTTAPGFPWNIYPGAIVGDPLVFSPKHRVTVSANYTLPLDEGIGQVSFGGTFVYTSAQNAFASNLSPFYRLPSNHTIDMNVRWDSIMGSTVDASFFVTNLTREKFVANMSGGWAFVGFDGYTPNQPRMFGLKIKYRY